MALYFKPILELIFTTMKYFIFILFLSTLNFKIHAQESYPWSEMQEVKFYNLSSLKINSSNFKMSDLDSVKSVSFKRKVWQKILPFENKVPNDVADEDDALYVITVKFKNGEIIPFKLFPNQKALFDLRENHFNYINLSVQVQPIFIKIFNKALICSNDKNCKEVF